MKSIFATTDYREALRAYYSDRKASPGSYSFARFSKELGLRSPNHSQLILEGKRTLSIEGVHAFADLALLNDDERETLEILRLREEVTAPGVIARYDRKLAALRKRKPPTTRRTDALSARGALDTDALLTEWYAPALLVLLDGKSTTVAEDLARRKLHLRAEIARTTITRLTSAGFLEIVDGRYRAGARHHVRQDRKRASLRQKAYLRSQLELSRRVFEERYETDAKFYSSTFTVGTERAEDIGRKLVAFIETLIQETDAPTNEEVVQINLQVFRPAYS